MGNPGSRDEGEGVAKQRGRSVIEIAGGHSRDPAGEEEVFKKVISQAGSECVKSFWACPLPSRQTGEDRGGLSDCRESLRCIVVGSNPDSGSRF